MAERRPLVVVNGRKAELPAGDTLPGAGGGIGGIATINPNTLGGAYEWTETVAAIGVTAASRIILGIGAHVDTDENAAELLDITAYNAVSGTNTITIEAAFSQPHSGPTKFNWSAL